MWSRCDTFDSQVLFFFFREGGGNHMNGKGLEHLEYNTTIFSVFKSVSKNNFNVKIFQSAVFSEYEKRDKSVIGKCKQKFSDLRIFKFDFSSSKIFKIHYFLSRDWGS